MWSPEWDCRIAYAYFNCSKQNKYVQKATLNGKELESPWFSWEEIKNGGELVLEMGDRPNYKIWTEGRAE